jgi:hypothetical protein
MPSKTLIIDNGAYSIKAGISFLDAEPRYDFISYSLNNVF